MIIFIIYQEDFKKLINERQHFWKSTIFGLETQEKLKFYPKVAYTGIKIYIIFLACTIVVLVMRPILSHQLIFPVLTPQGKYWFIIITLLQSQQCLYGTLFLIGFDSLFCLIYIDIIVQFKLLNLACTKMETIEDLDKCANHLGFLRM